MSCSLPPEGDENISVWLVSHEEVEEGDNMKLSWIVLALKDDFFFSTDQLTQRGCRPRRYDHVPDLWLHLLLLCCVKQRKRWMLSNSSRQLIQRPRKYTTILTPPHSPPPPPKCETGTWCYCNVADLVHPLNPTIAQIFLRLTWIC